MSPPYGAGRGAARRGVKSRSGERVRLRHVRVGGRVYIPADALPEFFTALAAADCAHFDAAPVSSPAPPRRGHRETPKQRRDAEERARRELVAAGILPADVEGGVQ